MQLRVLRGGDPRELSATLTEREDRLTALTRAICVVEHDRDALVVDAEILAQIANELGAREVDVGEHELGLGLRRNEPACGDPGLHRIALHMRAWLSTLATAIRKAQQEEHVRRDVDTEQVVFELHAIAMGANWAFQLFGDASAFERARTALRRSERHRPCRRASRGRLAPPRATGPCARGRGRSDRR